MPPTRQPPARRRAPTRAQRVLESDGEPGVHRSNSGTGEVGERHAGGTPNRDHGLEQLRDGGLGRVVDEMGAPKGGELLGDGPGRAPDCPGGGAHARREGAIEHGEGHVER